MWWARDLCRPRPSTTNRPICSKSSATWNSSSDDSFSYLEDRTASSRLVLFSHVPDRLMAVRAAFDQVSQKSRVRFPLQSASFFLALLIKFGGGEHHFKIITCSQKRIDQTQAYRLIIAKIPYYYDGTQDDKLEYEKV
jgi:hypothetical protein